MSDVQDDQRPGTGHQVDCTIVRTMKQVRIWHMVQYPLQTVSAHAVWMMSCIVKRYHGISGPLVLSCTSALNTILPGGWSVVHVLHRPRGARSTWVWRYMERWRGKVVDSSPCRGMQLEWACAPNVCAKGQSTQSPLEACAPAAACKASEVSSFSAESVASSLSSQRAWRLRSLRRGRGADGDALMDGGEQLSSLALFARSTEARSCRRENEARACRRSGQAPRVLLRTRGRPEHACLSLLPWMSGRIRGEWQAPRPPLLGLLRWARGCCEAMSPSLSSPPRSPLRRGRSPPAGIPLSLLALSSRAPLLTRTFLHAHLFSRAPFFTRTS